MERLFPQFSGRRRRFWGLSTSKLCLWIFGLCRGWLQESSHQRWLLPQIKMETLLFQALLRKQIKSRLSIKWVSIKWVFIVSTVRKLNKSVWAFNCVCVCVCVIMLSWFRLLIHCEDAHLSLYHTVIWMQGLSCRKRHNSPMYHSLCCHGPGPCVCVCVRAKEGHQWRKWERG